MEDQFQSQFQSQCQRPRQEKPEIKFNSLKDSKLKTR